MGRFQEFPGGPVVSMWYFHCCDPGSILGLGTRILLAVQYSQKKKKKRKVSHKNPDSWLKTELASTEPHFPK